VTIYSNNRYRIKRNATQEADMRKLVENGIFSSYADILTISAIVGYVNKRFVSIEKTAQDAVQLNFFSEEDRDIMDHIAYAHSKQQSILRKDEKYEIFEKYANGGFPILLEKLDIDSNEEIDRSLVLFKLYSQFLTGELKVDDNEILDEVII
jgi:dnd system-associated protein 4